MKMKSMLLLMLALCLTLCLCACGDDTATDQKDNKTTVVPSVSNNASVPGTTTITDSNNTTTSAPVVTGPTQPVNGKANYTITVQDEAGNPISKAYVQMCLELCLPGETNDQGIAYFPNMTVADYKVSFIMIPDGYTVENNEFHFEKDTYEMTIVLKKAA